MAWGQKWTQVQGDQPVATYPWALIVPVAYGQVWHHPLTLCSADLFLLQPHESYFGNTTSAHPPAHFCSASTLEDDTRVEEVIHSRMSQKVSKKEKWERGPVSNQGRHIVFPQTLLHCCEQRLGLGSTCGCREGVPSLFPSVAWT